MNISFEELRKIKHSLPTGSISKMAGKLGVEEQTIRNYFGAKKFENGQVIGNHVQPGPNGGIVSLEDTTILDMAKEIIQSAEVHTSEN